MEEIRLDSFIKEKYNFSREHSKEIITKGYVKVNGKIILKPAFKVTRNSLIELNSDANPKYVSRGGLKLEKALEYFNIDLNEKICLDIGASTGGFSDCMLQHKAKKVYAVDVGTSQLNEGLLLNEKVVSMENTDIRNIKKLPEKIDFIATDVSFISITKIMKCSFNLLDNFGEMVALIKPQFEAGKENINKSGIVKNKKIHKKVLEQIYNFCNEIGYSILGLTFSPIKGGKGNIEYLIYLSKLKSNKLFEIEKIVEEAFKKLN